MTEESNAADQTDDERRKAGLSPNALPPGEPSPGSLAPTEVKVSFWLWITAGVVYVIGYVIFLLNKQEIVDTVVKGNTDPKIKPETIDSSITTLLWMLVVGAVVFALLFALFAYKAREGTRSARSILAVLVVLVVLFQFMLQLFSLVTLFGVLIALFALALLFWPKVNSYFPKVGRKLP